MGSDERRTVSASTAVDPQAPGKGTVREQHSPATHPERRASDRRNDRGLPASVLTPPVPPPPAHLDDYSSIVGQGQLDTLRFLAKDLRGKTIKMVNSTAVGGGVAEMLNRLVPLLTELEVATHWDVITGGNDFFEVTKAFHNALHGSAYELTQSATGNLSDVQRAEPRSACSSMKTGGDPRSAACSADSLARQSRTPTGCGAATSICRIRMRRCGNFCGRSSSNTTRLFFLRSHLRDSCRSHNICFIPALIRCRRRTRNLPRFAVQKVCDEFGIDRSRPIVTQVSRFDRLKDPVGVVQAYKLAKKYVDCQLVLAGGGAS